MTDALTAQLPETILAFEESERVGHVTSVSGAHVSGILRTGDAIVRKPHGQAVQVGALVKIRTSISTMFGVVSKLNILNPSWPPERNEKQIIEVELTADEHTALQRSAAAVEELVQALPPLQTLVGAS